MTDKIPEFNGSKAAVAASLHAASEMLFREHGIVDVDEAQLPLHVLVMLARELGVKGLGREFDDKGDRFVPGGILYLAVPQGAFGGAGCSAHAEFPRIERVTASLLDKADADEALLVKDGKAVCRVLL